MLHALRAAVPGLIIPAQDLNGETIIVLFAVVLYQSQRFAHTTGNGSAGTIKDKAKMRHIIGCGIEGNTGEIIPIQVDDIGQIDGTFSGPITARGAHPLVILYGMTSSGDIVPFRVDLIGKLDFTS